MSDEAQVDALAALAEDVVVCLLDHLPPSGPDEWFSTHRSSRLRHRAEGCSVVESTKSTLVSVAAVGVGVGPASTRCRCRCRCQAHRAQGPGSTILFLPLWVWRHEPDLDKRIFVRWVRVAAAATHNTSLSTSFLVAQSSIPPLRTSTQGVISTSLSYLPLEAQPTPLSTHSPTTVRRCYRSANNHRLGTPPPRTHPDYLHLSHSALPDRADQIRSRDTRTTT
jgi:hypothetical protein